MADQLAPSPIVVRIEEFGASCVATAPAGITPEPCWAALCLAHVEAAGVPVDESLRETLDALIESHAGDPSKEHTAVLAEGTSPAHGENGSLKLLPRFDPEQIMAAKLAAAEAESGGGLDHRDRSAFVLIEAGEQIGTLHLPTFGQDGESVSGKPIVARHGKAVILNTDDSVIVRESGVIEAAVSGVVRIDGKKIRVLRRLDIHGPVDFTTGHIDFPGDVVVDEGVKDQFRVLARQDILVKGLVEAATLEAGRDLHLLGGAACREKGRLIAGRDLSARYLNECELRTGRHLAVQREIINSSIVIGGALISPDCTLIGGTAVITGRCELTEAGAERGTPTRIILGGKPEAEKLDNEARELLARLSERIKESEQARERLMEQGGGSSRALADKVSAIESEIGAFNKLEGTLTGAISGMRTAVQSVASVDLLVKGLLWRGVRITMPDWEVGIKESVKGPLRITCDPGEAPILRDLSSGIAVELSTVADVRSRTGDQAADEAVAA